MSVAVNIALAAGYPRRSGMIGARRMRAGLIGWRSVEAQAGAALDIIGCAIPPQTRIADLSRTDRSIVAIARALATQAGVIVLDEPTASLPEAESARLFTVLGRLRAQGGGMVYVSHRLDEIFRIADRVTVLRDGRAVATRAIADTTPAELVELIVGHQPRRIAARMPVAGAARLLEVGDLVAGEAGPVSFVVRPGEIVGLAGLRGAGQEEIGRAITGVAPPSDGTVRLAGSPVLTRSPADCVAAGIAFVSSRRQEESVALTLAIRENLFINPRIEGRGALAAMTQPTESGLAVRAAAWWWSPPIWRRSPRSATGC